MQVDFVPIVRDYYTSINTVTLVQTTRANYSEFSLKNNSKYFVYFSIHFNQLKNKIMNANKMSSEFQETSFLK